MAFFQSSNPTLTDKIFDRSRTQIGDMQGTMTVRGTMNKFGFTLLMLLGGAAYSWQVYFQNNPTLSNILFYGGMLGAFGVAIFLYFKPKLSTYLVPVFGILEGFFVGGLSVVINELFEEKFPGLVISAVGLTFGVAIAMFLLYNFRIIKPNNRFRSIVGSAMLGIAIFYLLRFLLSFAGVNMPFMDFGNNSMLGIGISLFVVIIASLHLILDFEQIESGADNNAPKYMEWYCSMGLTITLVWIYIELLRLLSRFSSKD